MPTIVVIEADDNFQKLLQMMLADSDADVVMESTGQAGLDAVRSHNPALVILDLTLPDMNGWEVFIRMRQEPNSQQTPVIILSEQTTRVDRTFGLQVAQVHEYLLKPFMPSQLRRSVASILKRT